MKKRHYLSCGFLILGITVPLLAQGIEVRTVPVIASNQADFQPSLSRGMGNLSIAFVDPLADPFVNPAKAFRLEGVRLFSAPTRNSWSNDEGRPVWTASGSSKYPGAAVNSIPFGAFIHSGDFFAGGLIAYQGVSSERTVTSTWGGIVQPDVFDYPTAIKKDIGNNAYVFGLVGSRLPDSKVSIAASIVWADYQAIDGVNLLYPGSYDIRQSGSSRAYKVGVVGDLTEEDQLEFVAERALFKATHDVTYIVQQSGPLPASFRTETNRDENKQWVLHGAYKRQLGQGWKIGGILTVNWKNHPKIPNYALANIPRDPGTTAAYNIGVGTVKETPRSTWGFEYIYEPITSNTWAEAGEAPPVPNLPPNFKTVENFFDFHNHILRVGLHSKTEHQWLDFRLGAQLHFYQYDLNQINNVSRTSRLFDQDWSETTLTGGLNFKFSNVELMYTLQLILGNGMVGTVGAGVTPTSSGGFRDAALNDIIIAPSGQLVVDKIPLVTQQITFVYRLE